MINNWFGSLDNNEIYIGVGEVLKIGVVIIELWNVLRIEDRKFLKIGWMCGWKL